MTNSELINAAIKALESEDPRSAEIYFSDKFVWKGTFLKLLDRRQFLGMMVALKGGFPDYTLNLKIVAETEEQFVDATMDPVGTHSGILAFPGMTPVQATASVSPYPGIGGILPL